MTPEEAEIELIENYHKGRLTDEERAEIDARIASDPEFADAVADYRLIMQGAHDHNADLFRHQLAGWEQEIAGKQVTSRSLLRYWPMAAVLLVIALAFAYFFEGADEPIAGPLLAGQYFKPYPDVLSVRGDDDLPAEALALYTKGSYAEAIPLFSTWVKAHPNDLDAAFYLGVAELADSDYDAAITRFDGLALKITRFADAVDWYRALAYLGADRRVEATLQLAKMAQSTDHDYHDQAEKLLKAVDHN